MVCITGVDLFKPPFETFYVAKRFAAAMNIEFDFIEGIAIFLYIYLLE